MEPVEVRRSARARRWRLEVPWGGPARLTVPRSARRADVERVLAERRLWIEKQRRRTGGRLRSGRAGGRAARGRLSADPDRRPTDTVGLVFRSGHAVLQLAARAGAAQGGRLRRRARALPPARPEPLAVVLVARGTTPPRVARAARMAARVRARAARIQSRGRRASNGPGRPKSADTLMIEESGSRAHGCAPEAAHRPPDLPP